VLNITIRPPSGAKEFRRYYQFRWRYLRAPWHQPPGTEKDQLEAKSIHLLACDYKNNILGVARLHYSDHPEQYRHAQIRYMAVAPAYRGQGVASRLLQALEAEAKSQGIKVIALNARKPALGFYHNHDYRIRSAAKTLFGCIQHYRMTKLIQN
jgi:GNAT superfamily N-acetyltransferase